MKILVTGAAGFIGSNLVDRLLETDAEVHGVDNFSTGNPTFLTKAHSKSNFSFFELDLLEDDFNQIDYQYDYIFHLAANADIRGGVKNSKIDLEQNIIVTHRLLEFSKRMEKKPVFVFSSTAAVLGEPVVFPSPEDISIPRQTSIYGASKMSCEAMISAYANTFQIESYVFRFVSILGPRYTHGHVFDFVKKLKIDPTILNVLGDGSAEKSYLHVDDCIDGIILISINKRPARKSGLPCEVYNLGVDETIVVADSARFIASCMNLSPKFNFEHQQRGWIGDNLFVHLSIEKMKKMGWAPKLGIHSAINETVSWLQNNPQIFVEREKQQAVRDIQ